MKKYLFFILSIVCSTLIAHAATSNQHETKTSKPIFRASTSVQHAPFYINGQQEEGTVYINTPRKTSPNKPTYDPRSGYVTIYPELLNGMSFVVAVGSDGTAYVAERNWETWTHELSLPEGKYDLCATGYGDDGAVIAIGKANVDIHNGTTIVFDANEAEYTTTVKNYSPTGEVLALPSSWETKDGNCTCSSKMFVFLINGICATYSPVSEALGTGYVVKSNFADGPFSMEVAESIISTEGVMNILLPIDFTKSEMGTPTSGWQFAENSFSTTPINKAYQEYCDANDLPHQSYSCFSLLYRNNWYGTMGNVVSNEFASQTGRIWFWKPEGYNGPLELLCYPGSNVVFESYQGGIMGLPFKAGETRPEVMGVNYASEMELVPSNNSYTFISVFPYYNQINSNQILGNCAPLLSIYPKDEAFFNFNFVGRHGEIFWVDTWYDSWSQFDPEIVQSLGITHSLKINYDGNLLTDNRADFPYRIDWNQQGVYEIEVATDNVLINGEVKGKTKGSVTFDTRKNNKIIPSVSAFQIVNKTNDDVTDMLENPGDGYIRLFAGDFKSQFNDQLYYYYCDVTEVEKVSVEYAPTGTGEYQSLEVTKGDLFITPGFGREYTADLSSIDRLGYGGWFDIRITVEDANGSVQAQEICPAFNLSSMSGIDEISCESKDQPTYYNLQGIRISNPETGSLVIERTGNASRKVIVK